MTETDEDKRERWKDFRTDVYVGVGLLAVLYICMSELIQRHPSLIMIPIVTAGIVIVMSVIMLIVSLRYKAESAREREDKDS